MRHLALIGMMAVGKTSVGRAVAERLGHRFADTDDMIAARTGRTPRALWEQGGEDAYRPRERAAVAEALASPDPVVLAVPGGVVVDPEMAALVRAPGVTTVHLRATLATLVRNVGPDARHRPLLGDDPPAALARLLDERGARYEALADAVVDVDDRTPDEVAAAVVEAVARISSTSPDG